MGSSHPRRCWSRRRCSTWWNSPRPWPSVGWSRPGSGRQRNVRRSWRLCGGSPGWRRLLGAHRSRPRSGRSCRPSGYQILSSAYAHRQLLPHRPPRRRSTGRVDCRAARRVATARRGGARHQRPGSRSRRPCRGRAGRARPPDRRRSGRQSPRRRTPPAAPSARTSRVVSPAREHIGQPWTGPSLPGVSGWSDPVRAKWPEVTIGSRGDRGPGEPASGRLLLLRLGLARDQRRSGLTLDHFAGHDDLADVTA